MFYWSSFPLVRLILPFITGIITFHYSGLKFGVGVLVALILIVLTVLLGLHFTNRKYFLRWINGAIINVLFFVFGYSYACQTENRIRPPDSLFNKEVSWIGEVQSIAERGEELHSAEIFIRRYF